MTKHVLLAWLGMTDLKAASGDLAVGLGPIAQATSTIDFEHVYLLTDQPAAVADNFAVWLKETTKALIEIVSTPLRSPTDYEQIYESAVKTIERVRKDLAGANYDLTFHLSPGTPAMAAIWILLSRTSCPANLIESSVHHGVKKVNFPFELAADYTPGTAPVAEEEMIRLTQGLPPEAPEFEQIVHRCKAMKRVVFQARRLALHDVPVLIYGESGTGKELFARAIHFSGSRGKFPFVTVNCGAIPRDLFEAEFFGYVKGAFTGASRDHIGYMESANKGTLFLDEIGEMPLAVQVKLLRALQDGTFQRIGSSKTSSVSVRVIAATNRDLVKEIGVGNFRQDLFHRLAVGVLRIPPLRERSGDIDILIDNVLERVNRELAHQPAWVHKKLSAGARNLLHQHTWPGNVRELVNTITRAAIWTAAATISSEDIRQALFPVSGAEAQAETVLNRSLDTGVDLQGLLGEIASHYLRRALVEAHGNKTLAAQKLGLPSYQTFTNWMNKYGVRE